MIPEPSESERRRFAGLGTNRSFYLPRLPREYYQGDAVVHWTLSIAWRGTGWLNDLFHAQFRELLLHAAAREGLFCPTYCLMPDHMHLVWMGLRRDSDQRNGMKFLREHVGKRLLPHRFQHQAHDHVLREEQRKREVFRKMCFYIMDNARVAGLVEAAKDWAYSGAVVPGYPEGHPFEPDFWPRFWKFYLTARAADAGEIKRPPIS